MAIAAFGALLAREGKIVLGGFFTMIAKALGEKMEVTGCTST